MRILRREHYQAMPWKNGGGLTHEILREPGDGGAFAWRLSLATIERPGEFSEFPGCARTIVLFEGGGAELDFGAHGRAILAAPDRALHFDGGWKARVALPHGPVRVLNLIVDRAHAGVDTAVFAVGDRLTLERSGRDTRLAVCLAGALEVGAADPVKLRPGDTVALDGAAPDTLSLARGDGDIPALVFVAALGRSAARSTSPATAP